MEQETAECHQVIVAPFWVQTFNPHEATRSKVPCSMAKFSLAKIVLNAIFYFICQLAHVIYVSRFRTSVKGT